MPNRTFMPFAVALFVIVVAVPFASAQSPDGKAAFDRACAGCHGAAGVGDVGPRLVPFTRGNRELLGIVREGSGQMPAISESDITDDEILAVAEYLRSLKEAAAKPSAAGRTGWGHPDLQGTWSYFDSTPFEQPVGGWKAAPRLAAGVGGIGRGFDRDWINSPISPLRPSMVVDPPDGRVPVRPEAEAIRLYNLARYADNWVHQSPWERCITRGVPGGMFPSNYNNALEIIQTPDHIVIHQEMIHEPRIIPVDGRPHLPSRIRQWMGDARGRWDGDTLVVETTNFTDKAWIANNGASGRIKGIPVSEELHVTERFTRVAENRIDYEVTIVDPKIYTAPWKAYLPLNLDPGYRILEYACHEGNLQMPHALSTGRAIDREKEEAAKVK